MLYNLSLGYVYTISLGQFTICHNAIKFFIA